MLLYCPHTVLHCCHSCPFGFDCLYYPFQQIFQSPFLVSAPPVSWLYWFHSSRSSMIYWMRVHSLMKIRVGARQGPERYWVSQNSLWAHTSALSLPQSPCFSESGKGGARRREGKKEEMTNWENYFAICGTCCVWVVQGRREGGVFLSTCWEALWTEK